MAQYWVVCDDASKFVWYSNNGNDVLSLTVVTDDGGDALSIEASSNITVAYFGLFPTDLVASTQADVRVLVRDASDRTARGLGAGCQIGTVTGTTNDFGYMISSGATDNRFYADGSEVATSGTPSIDNSAYHWSGLEYELSGSDQIVRLYKWTGDAGDRPASYF